MPPNTINTTFNANKACPHFERATSKSAAPVLAEESAKIHSVPDEEVCEDLFLSCNELEEDETVTDDD